MYCRASDQSVPSEMVKHTVVLSPMVTFRAPLTGSSHPPQVTVVVVPSSAFTEGEAKAHKPATHNNPRSVFIIIMVVSCSSGGMVLSTCDAKRLPEWQLSNEGGRSSSVKRPTTPSSYNHFKSSRIGMRNLWRWNKPKFCVNEFLPRCTSGPRNTPVET
jgi:hypothetical protein